MEKQLVSRRKSNCRRSDPTPADATFQDFVQEAELCCEHARLAARLKRFEASRGLFLTAAALYHRAITAAGTCYPSIENRLREIELEMAAYSELARSMARPLLSQPPVAPTGNSTPASNNVSTERAASRVKARWTTSTPTLRIVR
ncbi:MAG TPA: hypothetical protein VNA16_08650 [Abditibacteriaceae bacterium]|nr:hypothetical protein [Abditibacteriaceae bacterium]